MSDALIAFAKTGNPNTPTITWPRYDPANEKKIEFGEAIRVVAMNAAALDFFVAHPATAAPPAAIGSGRSVGAPAARLLHQRARAYLRNIRIPPRMLLGYPSVRTGVRPTSA